MIRVQMFKIINASLCKEAREEILRVFEKATNKCGETFKFCFERPIVDLKSSYISKRRTIMQSKQSSSTKSDSFIRKKKPKM